MKQVYFSKLKDKTISKIENLEVGRGYDELITFECTDGSKFGMKYDPDCCASCDIEDIIGDVQDLIGTPVLLAEEIRSTEPSPEVQAKRDADLAKQKAEFVPRYEGHTFFDCDTDSETWTFYKLSTIKGSVTIRWYGESNGYYSESASFYDLNQKESWEQ